MHDDEGTIRERLAQLEDEANIIRGLLTKARLGVLAKPDFEIAMRVTTLQDLLKSTLARAEWLRRKGSTRIVDERAGPVAELAAA